MKSTIVLFTFFLTIPHLGFGQTDSLQAQDLPRKHLGGMIDYSRGRILHMDAYDRIWMKTNKASATGLSLQYYTFPKINDEFAVAYNYPVFSGGILWSNYTKVTMHKAEKGLWGKLIPEDYVSNAGQLVTIFTTFERPLWRTGNWRWSYVLGTGLGIAGNPYNNTNNIDNELLGATFNIYFQAGIRTTWQFDRHWAAQFGIDFKHHSNGATSRPNKGSNYVAPNIGLLYTPDMQGMNFRRTHRQPFQQKQWNTIVAGGLGGKTLLEEWQESQFNTPKGENNYRKNTYTFYPSYSLQISELYRYALRWASGIGLDVNYAKGVDKIRAIDQAHGVKKHYSPWSLGIALRHEAYYQHWSATCSFGIYLLRKRGKTAEWEEKPFYERVGLRYYFGQQRGFFIGTEVKAHSTRADMTEVVFGYKW